MINQGGPSHRKDLFGFAIVRLRIAKYIRKLWFVIGTFPLEGNKKGTAAGALEAFMTMVETRPAATVPTDRSLLMVDDDKSFLQRLARAMEGRGFAVTTAESVAEG